METQVELRDSRTLDTYVPIRPKLSDNEHGLGWVIALTNIFLGRSFLVVHDRNQ
jgi:hypothetical protein